MNFANFARTYWKYAVAAIGVVIFVSMIHAGGTCALLGLSLTVNAVLCYLLSLHETI